MHFALFHFTFRLFENERLVIHLIRSRLIVERVEYDMRESDTCLRWLLVIWDGAWVLASFMWYVVGEREMGGGGGWWDKMEF